ncbi:hypothetical protein SALBM311S_00570 [Streptomyces alboniger]
MGSLIAFIVVALIGAILTPVFALVPDADDLPEVAWSAPFQTVRTALTVLVFWGWSPLMLGSQPSLPADAPSPSPASASTAGVPRHLAPRLRLTHDDALSNARQPRASPTRHRPRVPAHRPRERQRALAYLARLPGQDGQLVAKRGRRVGTPG